jgi:hypothetical protein
VELKLSATLLSSPVTIAASFLFYHCIFLQSRSIFQTFLETAQVDKEHTTSLQVISFLISYSGWCQCPLVTSINVHRIYYQYCLRATSSHTQRCQDWKMNGPKCFLVDQADSLSVSVLYKEPGFGLLVRTSMWIPRTNLVSNLHCRWHSRRSTDNSHCDFKQMPKLRKAGTKSGGSDE